MTLGKVFLGRKVRALRIAQGLTQAELASSLGISTSYINQIELNNRPVSASVLMALAQKFSVDIGAMSESDSGRLLISLNEALADPVFGTAKPPVADLKVIAQNMPEVGRALLACHQAYQRLGERLASLDTRLDAQSQVVEPSPYDEVRDFFHYADNYLDELDLQAEATARTIGLPDRAAATVIEGHLQAAHGVRVRYGYGTEGVLRRFDRDTRQLDLNALLPPATLAFQLAFVLGQIEASDVVEKLVGKAGLRTRAAEDICRIGLYNYYAGALLMPYRTFQAAARDTRHDIDILAARFGASLEQVAHRLSTLQRPDCRGLPVFFARVDRAGNITKRHSAAKLQFARFGAACPLWNVHSAFEAPGRIIRQLAETPDGVRYLCVATQVQKVGAGFHAPKATFAIALGCEIVHAKAFVYADGLNLSESSAFEPIGISCKICERPDCFQRAVPPLKSALVVDHDARALLPYNLTDWIEPEGAAGG